jgi:hypothetical protein
MLCRHPLILAVLAVVLFVLLGGLRGMGLPRLFWHERWLHRLLAGAAVTAVAAEAFLVAWLLDESRGLWPVRLDVPAYAAWTAGLWAALISLCAAVRFLHDHGSARKKTFRISPVIERPGAPELVTARAPIGFFLLGGLVGGAIAAGVIFGARAAAAPWADDIAALVPRTAQDPLAHVAALASVVLMVIVAWAVRRVATPAVGISFLLALVLGAHGFLQFWLDSSGLAWIALLVGLAVGGRRIHKLRIRDLRAEYRHPIHYPPREAKEPLPRPPLAWDHACARSGDGRRPLIVVCASGGGLRAATWTAGVLGRLDERPGFRPATRLVTGASGGMVGAAAWAASTRLPDKTEWAKLCGSVGALDALTAVARTLVFEDIPRAFLPGASDWNRGEALAQAFEAQLRAALGADASAPFSALLPAEERLELPSLVFSPMLVEDGRRLLLGNLDLAPVTDNSVLWLSSEKTHTEPVVGLASRTAYHASRLFPDRWAKIRLSTAARLSAAFPYVSPAAVLPTKARRRAVDAGYFDNYGLELACAWLRRLVEDHVAWMKANVSEVLVLQIRDNVSNLSVNPETDDRTRAHPTTALKRGLEGITSPPEGLLAARESVMLFRNDAQLAALRTLFDTAGLGKDAVKTTIFEFKGEASLSWTLAKEEIDAIRAQVASDGIKEKIDAIELWLGRTGSGSSGPAGAVVHRPTIAATP